MRGDWEPRAKRMAAAAVVGGVLAAERAWPRAWPRCRRIQKRGTMMTAVVPAAMAKGTHGESFLDVVAMKHTVCLASTSTRIIQQSIVHISLRQLPCR